MTKGTPWSPHPAGGGAPVSAVAEITGPLGDMALARAITGPAARLADPAAGEPAATITVDLSGLPEAGRAGHADRLVRRTVTEPCPAHGPGRLRFSLVRTTSRSHLLIVTAHPTIGDPPALVELLRSVAAAYPAAGGPAAIQTRPGAPGCAGPRQPAGRAHEPAGQRGADHDDRSWWQRYLAGATIAAPLRRGLTPAAAAGASGIPGTGPRIRTPAPPGLVRLAQAAADRFGFPFRTALLAGLAAVLARYQAGPDVTIGLSSPDWPAAAGRPQGDSAVRIAVGDEPSFATLLARADAATRVASQHGPIPPEVVDAVAGAGRPPSLPVRLYTGPPPRAVVVAGPLRWSIREPTYAPAQAELTLRWDGFATVWLEQDCDGDELAAARLLGHLGVLLEGATAHPGERLPWLPLLTAAERDSLAEWNATAAPYPGERTVHSLIEDQADRTPFTVAVSAGDDHLSYRELDRRANQLAHLLRDRGVGPETLVGVVATRSTGTIVAMLAVLKAGGAYVPLDPDYPPTRLRIIRDDADLHLVIAEPDVACLVPDGNQGTIAAGDAARHGYPGTRPAPLAGPANLAYVIYTSGSTGQPKGVLVPHRQIVHSTAARWAHGRFSPGAYAPPVPLSFDASCAAIYWSLCRGGRLVLPTDAAAKDPRLFAKLIKDENVTHLTGMPSFYALVLSAGSHPLRTIRDASIGGEVMPPDVPAEHAHTLPLARLYNDYGPTEATVWSTTHLCRGDERGASVPIGRPIQNVRVHVLDHNLQPVPAGFPGQICIAGEGLARGYLGRLAATAEHFVPDPFGPPGSRMYLTGDLGVLGPDGELEFAGRIDAQVKVRGFRVELTEIESVLREHPGVAAAAVAADRRDGDTRLVAHVVAGNPARPPSDSDLAACLRGQLPGYMVPSKIVFRDSIPVSPTGKIDRAALTTPSRPGPPRSGGPDDVGDVVAAMTEESLDMLLAGLLSPADRDGTVLHPIRPQAGPDLHPTAMEATDMDETGDRTELAVVRNDEEQYSVWRADREPPAGWHPTGFRGPRDACLEHIATVWTDMRPLSLRRAMDG